jgi:hypothetical protein
MPYTCAATTQESYKKFFECEGMSYYDLITQISNTGNKMKCLYIKADYNTGFILPIELLESLYQFEMVQGEVYNDTLKFIKRPLDIRVIDYDAIKSADPDPTVLLASLEHHKAKLQEELNSIEAQINKI